MKKALILSFPLLFTIFGCNQNGETIERPEVSIIHNDEPIHQELEVVCWENCGKSDNDFNTISDIDINDFENIEVNDLDEEAELNVSIDGTDPDRIGYVGKAFSDHGVTEYAVSLDTKTIQLETNEDAYYVLLAQWENPQNEVLGYIKIKFHVE